MLGIDIVEISRFREMSNLEMFIRRVFTKSEADYLATKKAAKGFYSSLAGHFAAKEAFAKAVGTGVRGFSLSDIEVCHDKLGKPYLKYGGVTVNGALTISHSDTMAVAVVYMSNDISGVGLPMYTHIDEYKGLIPLREKNTNKGDFGKVFIVGGSQGMSGSVCLSAMGALRCGSGLVTVGVPKSIKNIVEIKLTEAITMPLPEIEESGTLSLTALGDIKSKLSHSDVCVFGMGMGKNQDISKLIDSLLNGSTNFVLDADALGAIAEDMDVLRKHKNRQSCQIVITPHPGEMSRLLGESIETIQKARVSVAKEFAKEYGVIVVLKGSDTVIASPDGRVQVNKSGTSGMATAGTGDVLSGVIGSFMGQGLDAFDASVLGAFIHGVAGDLAVRDKGEHGMIASDVIENIPYAIKLVLSATDE